MLLAKTLWINSLSLRILLTFVSGILLSIGFLLLFGAMVKDRLPGMDLAERTIHLVRKLEFDGKGKPIGFRGDAEHPHWLYDSLSEETAFRVMDDRGDIVLMSPGVKNWPDLASMAERERRRFEFTHHGVFYEGATEPFEYNGKIWFMQLTVSSRIVSFLHQEFALPFIRLGITVFSVLLLFVFSLCAYVSLKYALSPLREASRIAASITPQSLSDRVPTQCVVSEIVPLINSFNHALDRLEKGYRLQQDFLAKAAHELKTPLTLIRAEVETMEGDTSPQEPLLMHVAHLARHVQQILLLAEVSEPLSYRFQDVDVGEVAHDAVFFLQKIADDVNVKLIIRNRCEKIQWQADRGALFTLLKNLIENAIQHAPAATEISIEINSNGIGIRDRGPGVEPEQLSLIFSRFWRGDHRRDLGAGLGLAICREIALAHEWSLSARNGHPGLIMVVMN
ncbi:Sensor kinase CusS [Serratia ficaria]|uniref:ATP-binding protein n=1 Tax=Serratia ficaria TaxID=61651 RepID=UPI002178D56A|nr:ATP-binding protein [Serratia ficaria]CAI2151217.1 Sensor kinase CusS [Serratia ficaria]CAI2483745.1 Sensor kinase CusS [Serratia ficaria]